MTSDCGQLQAKEEKTKGSGTLRSLGMLKTRQGEEERWMRAGPSSLLPFKTKRKKKHLSILIVVESRRVTEERNVCL